MKSPWTPAPVKPVVTFEALDALDIRVGTIVSVEEVPKSEKLVRLTVDFGDHQRRILAGMKQERADAREIEGKQALFVVNLAPRKMMGEMSEGMLFDIGARRAAVPRRPGARHAERREGGLSALRPARFHVSRRLAILPKLGIAMRRVTAMSRFFPNWEGSGGPEKQYEPSDLSDYRSPR